MSQYTADWLRRRYAEVRLPPPAAQSGLPPPLIPAAVLVPVIDRRPHATVLFTQRTAHLHDHAGQVSFPGGRCETEDESPVATALREAQEEIGLAPERVEVLGTLPEYRTSTGFRVTPVLGIVQPPLELQLDSFEVAEVFETPLSFLLDPANHQRHSVDIAGTRRHYYAMPYSGYYIWGATAGMVVELYRLLSGGLGGSDT
ncbi:MAG: CoA pyrophosphatase [Pseudomonadota bacterium]